MYNLEKFERKSSLKFILRVNFGKEFPLIEDISGIKLFLKNSQIFSENLLFMSAEMYIR